MKSKKPYIWIVEMWNVRRGIWEPAPDLNFSKASCILCMKQWQYEYPNDKFRSAKYVRDK